jgi:hypothetical protein
MVRKVIGPAPLGRENLDAAGIFSIRGGYFGIKTIDWNGDTRGSNG